MYLPDTAVTLVDGTDFCRQNKAAGKGIFNRYAFKDGGNVGILEPEKSGFGRLQVFPQLSEPPWMGKITRADNVNALDSTPGGKSGKVARFARSS